MICNLHKTFIKMIKYKRKKWAKHVAYVGHNTGLWPETLKVRYILKDPLLHGIILKPILKKQWDFVDWSNVSGQGPVLAFVNTVMNIRVTWKGLNFLNNWAKIPSHQWFCSTELFRVYVAVHIRMVQYGTCPWACIWLLYYCLQQGRTLFSSLSSIRSYGADS